MSSPTRESEIRAAVGPALQRAMRYARVHDYTGPDPYDGLTSPLARGMRSPRLRQAWAQAHKHGGLALRRATGVPPVRMTKGLALFSAAALRMGEDDLARELIRTIFRERGTGPWGYEFDVQTRWGFYPAGSPNVVATTFALRAIRDAGLLVEVSSGVQEWLAGQFQTDGGYFAYNESSARLIHNGSLLAAESLTILGAEQEMVERALSTALRAQTAEGAWPYGEGPSLKWVDSVHTIYVLDSLALLSDAGFDTQDAIGRGVSYWKRHFLQAEGLPLYHADSARPARDIHSVATSVAFMARALGAGWELPAPEPAMERLLAFQQADGGFRRGMRGPAYMRWNQAHAAFALAEWGSQL